MKTQLHPPAHGPKVYSKEYQEEALHLWRKSGRSASKVAAELGIRPHLLYQWAKRERGAAEHGGTTPSPKTIELQDRIRELMEENAKLTEEREALKKSLGILCERPPRGMPKSSK